MLLRIILILLGVYFIVKMLCPGFDIDISWNVIWPVILMVLGIEGIIRAKKLDLRDVLLKDDAVINCYAIFGGIDLTVPDDANIIIHSSSLFGGVNNKTSNKNSDNKKTIYINVTAIFGGVDVKE